MLVVLADSQYETSFTDDEKSHAICSTGRSSISSGSGGGSGSGSSRSRSSSSVAVAVAGAVLLLAIMTT